MNSILIAMMSIIALIGVLIIVWNGPEILTPTNGKANKSVDIFTLMDKFGTTSPQKFHSKWCVSSEVHFST